MSKTLIIATILLAGIIILTVVIFSRQAGSPQTAPSPTPFSTFTPSVITQPSLIPGTPAPVKTPIPSNLSLTKEQLQSLTPLQLDNFNVEYYLESDSFLITIKESPYEENKALAEKWLTDKGLDLSTLKLEWTSLRNVE